jgi:hypothetical protein
MYSTSIPFPRATSIYAYGLMARPTSATLLPATFRAPRHFGWAPRFGHPAVSDCPPFGRRAGFGHPAGFVHSAGSGHRADSGGPPVWAPADSRGRRSWALRRFWVARRSWALPSVWVTRRSWALPSVWVTRRSWALPSVWVTRRFWALPSVWAARAAWRGYAVRVFGGGDSGVRGPVVRPRPGRPPSGRPRR